MQIVFGDGPEGAELDVRVNHPSATVDDLARALARGRGGQRLVIGGRPADGDVALTEAGLHEGVVVRFADAAGPADPASARRAGRGGGSPARGRARELVVVGGLDAGRRFPLPAGTAVVGRGASCDIALRDGTLSRRHAAVTVTAGGGVEAEDLGSHNGTWRGDRPVVAREALPDGAPLRLGALAVEVRAVRGDDRPRAADPRRDTTGAGTVPFNRPPRPAPPPEPGALRLPRPPRAGQGKPGFSLMSTLAPVAMAGAMYLVMHSARVLVFAALAPVMGIASALDGRRKGRRSERAERDRFARELAAFRDDLAAAADGERARRQEGYPDPPEVARRAMLPSTTLWERRSAHPDFLRLRAGVGDVAWAPPAVARPSLADLPAELRQAVDAATVLAGSPVPLDLSSGGVVGVVGHRGAALALARSLLCQAAVLHGPADLPVMALTRPGAAAAWDWAKWLPHTRDPSGSGRLLSADPELSTRLVEARIRAAGPRARPGRPAPGAQVAGPTVLVVVDDESLTDGRRSPIRALLRGDAGPVAGIVVASTVDRLPAVCTAVVEVADPDGRADLSLPQRGEQVLGFEPAGMADDVARACARALARFEDPELELAGAGLPGSIRLLPLLELEGCTPDAVLARWRAGGVDPRPAAPVGISDDGVFAIDLVADGPHALVGGTTGAGKSELLRTLVAGLAASVDPDHLTFVLVDFKGGSAFDECARLPHTVGLVTDLDEHLAERALRCLEAELRHRERLLRDAGAIDLPDYLRAGAAQPLPRLLVVIDEFATLKTELPDFVDALVGVAQRGRSLGVHLLLATQRPRGAISDNIRANTNLRIALRVQDASDSRDVIDASDAAAIPRDAPGRAFVRLGPGEVVAIQSARSTGARTEASLAHVDVAPFVFGPCPRPPEPGPPAGGGAPTPAAEAETDLAVLVATIEAAFARTGRPRPRRPWPDPLPGEVDLDAVLDAARAAGGGSPCTPLGLADDPEAQTQYPAGWNRGDGNLVVYGIGGSGTTTALSSLALSLARTCTPDEVHVYVLDFGAGELAALDPLPHVGGVLLAGERERQARLIRLLRAELDRRREMGPAAARAEPGLVVLVDGWSTFVAAYNDLAGAALWEAFVRVFADGPEVGITTVVAADRAAAVSGTLASAVRQRLALRLADAGDYATLGVRGSAVPEMVPGRALVGGTGQVVQIARPRGGVAAAAARLAASAPAAARPPARIEALATRVRVDRLGAVAELGARPWTIPIGVAERTRQAASLIAYRGEHVLVVGPARSGRSSALLAVAAACRAGRPGVRVVAVAGPRSPLGGDPLVDAAVGPSQVGERLAGLVAPAAADEVVVVLVDDAEVVDDAGGVLERLATTDRADLLLVAAGRNDGVRTGYAHWTRPLRRSRLGVLLRPDVDLDGDILGATIPRRAPVAMAAGRGYLAAGGDVELVQLALPR